MPISTGKLYKDEVLYDVNDMDARHVLLGCPWKFDVCSFTMVGTTFMVFHGRAHKIAMALHLALKAFGGKGEQEPSAPVIFIVMSSDEAFTISFHKEEAIYGVMQRVALTLKHILEEAITTPGLQHLLTEFRTSCLMVIQMVFHP